MRSRVMLVIVLVAIGGCKRSDSVKEADASPPAAASGPSSSEAPCPAAGARVDASASASASPSASASLVVDAGALPPPKDITAAVARLGDKRQAVRDAAAAEIRAAIAANPAASRDKGEAFWRAKLDAVPAGTTRAEYIRMTGAKPTGSLGGGGGETANFRLDDYWVCSAYFETESPKKMMKHGHLVRAPIEAGVDLGPSFTGHSTFYRIDGTKSEELDFVKGEVTRRQDFHLNGQLNYEQAYDANGRPHGPYRAFYESGQKKSECSYAHGDEVGLCVHWWPNGKKQSEETSVDGKKSGRSTHWREDGSREVVFEYRDGVETGQAAYDECDRAIYAHGTLGDGGT